MLTVLRLALSLAAAAGFATNSAVLPRSRVGVRHGLTVVMDEEKAKPPPAKAAPAAPAAEADKAEEDAPPAPPPPPAVVYSESMPFLVKRKALDGYVGDVGFDPVGFSEILPMVRAACARKTLPLPVCARHTDAAAAGHDRCRPPPRRPPLSSPGPHRTGFARLS